MEQIIKIGPKFPNKGYIIQFVLSDSNKFTISSVNIPTLWEAPDRILLDIKEYLDTTGTLHSQYLLLYKTKNTSIYKPASNSVTYSYTYSTQAIKEIYLTFIDMSGKRSEDIIIETGMITIN